MIKLNAHPVGRHFLQIPGPSPVPVSAGRDLLRHRQHERRGEAEQPQDLGHVFRRETHPFPPDKLPPNTLIT